MQWLSMNMNELALVGLALVSFLVGTLIGELALTWLYAKGKLP